MKTRKIIFIFIALTALDIFLWYGIVFAGNTDKLVLDFFNVGQGDSQLVNLPEGAQILIDGGPDGRVLQELSKALNPTDRYIDLVVLTHADADHVGGLPQVFERYQVGAFIYNGRGSNNEFWRELVSILKNKEIPVLAVGEGDEIKIGESKLSILNPGPMLLQSDKANDASIVTLLQSKNIKALFTADIAFTTENYLLDKYDLDVDILKVAHHGSKLATSREFLDEATPKVSIIQVGKNRYGHPTKNTLENLKLTNVKIYRNDLGGTITVTLDGKKLLVTREH